MNISIDSLNVNNLKIVQDKDSFCSGIDAVLLSKFAIIRKKNKVADLGTGNGILPILLSAQNDSSEFCGFEIQHNSAELARKSVEINSLENRIHIIEDNLLNAFNHVEKNTFDVVVSNPPYMKSTHGNASPNDAKAIARHEITCTLDDITRIASGLLKSRGKFYLIHRPQRLSEIMMSLKKYLLEPRTIQFIHPHKNENATMVMIEAQKCVESYVVVKEPIVVYN